jgi:hypothetical protein
LEASVEYADRVRGEAMVPWGVAEARRLGVEQVLLDAGGHVSPVWRPYEGTGSRPFDIPVSALVPGIPGTLNMRHPDACQALLDAADGRACRFRVLSHLDDFVILCPRTSVAGLGSCSCR